MEFLSETETKVWLAIIDADLTIRSIKKYPLSKNGKQINVISGGTGHFMPAITNTSYVLYPYRSFPFLWKKQYKRVYFAVNKAVKCIDFESGEVPLPSSEQLNESLANTMIGQIGKDNQGMVWWQYAVTLFSFLTFLMMLSVMS